MFIGTYGNVLGLGALTPYLLMINNAASGVGRIVGGVAADHYGLFNIGIVACVGMSIMMFAWMAIDSAGGLVALCIVYGFLSGVPVSLQAPMLMATVRDVRLTGTLIGQSMGTWRQEEGGWS
jgi:predicted MFS family arabinose efflux permease